MLYIAERPAAAGPHAGFPAHPQRLTGHAAQPPLAAVALTQAGHELQVAGLLRADAAVSNLSRGMTL